MIERYSVLDHIKRQGGYLVFDAGGNLVKYSDHAQEVFGLKEEIKKLKKKLTEKSRDEKTNRTC